MHRAQQPSHGSDLFKRNIFGGSKTPTSTRPNTSSGSPTTHSESHSSTTSTSQRKPSISLSRGSQRGRNNSTAQSKSSPEKKRSNSSHAHTDRTPLPINIPIRQVPGPKPVDNSRGEAASTEAVQSPLSGTDSFTSTTPYSNMLARPGTGYTAPGIGGPPLFAITQQPPSPTLEKITYQHIHETSSKRISTLDYLRKAYVKHRS